ncbi:MAG: Heimdall-CTERM domain-containing surface protein [Candidatus Odinarchaeota archaeon]
MRKIKYFGISFVVFFLLGTSTGLVTPLPADYASQPTWEVPDQAKLIYEITTLVYNASTLDDSMPITVEEDYLGNITEGEIYFIEYWGLPDLSGGYTTFSGWQRGVNTKDSWSLEYTAPLNNDSAWTSTGNGLMFPVIPVWSDEADWNAVGANFTAMDGDFTVTNDATHFTVEYWNSTASPTGYRNVTSVWNKATGVLEYYFIDTDEGPENEYLKAEMNFLYFRDESQWDVHFGINEEDMVAWNVTTARFGSNNEVELLYDVKEEEMRNVTEGDRLVIRFSELWQPEDNREPNWNGSVMTSEYSFWAEYSFGEEGGAPLLFPIWMLGNDFFYGNITDEFESMGMTVTRPAGGFQIDWIGGSGDGAEFDISAQWDDRGLLNFYHITGDVNGTSAEIFLEFLYYIPFVEYDYFLPEEPYVSYYMKTIRNGTNDHLDFMEGWSIYEGDQVSYYFDFDVSPEVDYTYSMSVMTNRGYETEADVRLLPPGLEHAIGGGSPAGWPVVPLPVGPDTDDYYSNITAAWESLDYTVHENADVFGFEGITANDFYLNVSWSKVTGLMMYYNASGEIDGFDYVMEAELSMYFDSAILSWQVPENLYVRYLATVQNSTSDEIMIGGNEDGPIFIYDGDIFSVKFGSFWATGGMGYELYARTSSGYETESEQEAVPPGFEFARIAGPPGLKFAVPVSSDPSFYEDAIAIWTTAGYTVTNNEDEIGFEGDIVIPEFGTANVSILWDKEYGILNYYYVEGYDEYDNYVELELTIGTTLLPVDISYNWAVSTGYMGEYHFTTIDYGGDNRIEFGDGHYMHIDETITFTVSALSVFSTTDMQGPWANMSIAATYHTEYDVFFGIAEPGFEFADFDSEGGNGAPPLFYPVFPIFDASWVLMEDMYREGGYTVIRESNKFTLKQVFEDGQYVEATWDMTDGHLTWYNASLTMEIEGTLKRVTMVLVEGAGTYIPPEPSTTTSESSTTTTSAVVFSPGFETLFLFVALVTTVVIRRKKK